MDTPKILFLVLSIIGFLILYSVSLKTFSFSKQTFINSTKIDVMRFLNENIIKCRSECAITVVSSDPISPSDMLMLDKSFNMSGTIPAGKKTKVMIRHKGSGYEIIPVSGVVG